MRFFPLVRLRIHPTPAAGKAAARALSRLGSCFLLALACLTLAGLAYAQPASGPLPTLTAARAVHGLLLDDAARGYPVQLRGVVTYCDPYLVPQYPPILFVSDSSGSIFVKLSEAPTEGLRPGDRVEVTGVSAAGDFAPVVRDATVKVTGRARLPREAPKASMSDLLSGARDAQWVEVEGIVHSAREEGGNVFLDLVLRDGHLSAVTVKKPGVGYTSLVDTRIKIRGNAAPLFNRQGQMTGARLFFPDNASVTMEEAGSLDPFSETPTAIDRLLRYTPNQVLLHRAHLRGTVTLLWPGRSICIQDGVHGMCAQTEQETPIPLGAVADVVGFPSIGAFTPTLDNATYQAAGGSQEVSVSLVSLAGAASGEHDAQLVAIEGRVVGLDLAADDPTLVLDDGHSIFVAILPGIAGTKGSPAFAEGNLVRVTGICAVRADVAKTETGAGFSVGKKFRILVRSTGDVKIVEPAFWWNARHTLWVLAVALGFALLALGSAVLLWVRVHRQKAVIHVQLIETAALKEAAEAAHREADFQASHDALTGVLNRRAIFDALRREFELAKRSATPTGVMMLDLDHFKRVNDTCGHLAGDDLLKEAVRRILNAVRSTDLVGRYGGEEFLIVLPNCDGFHLQRCAERVRMAIAIRPIEADGRLLAVTASVGATVGVAPRHSPDDALRIADAALYRAKNSGRNQVVAVDMDLDKLDQLEEALSPLTPSHAQLA